MNNYIQLVRAISYTGIAIICILILIFFVMSMIEIKNNNSDPKP